MKIGGRDVAAFCAKPPQAPAVLIYGADAMRVSTRRQELIRALIGPEGEAEMRLARLSPSDLRETGARLADEMRALGFFAGPRAVLLEGAGEPQAAAVGDAIAGWAAGDATLVVTAGSLAARSGLRKLFEQHDTAAALPIYDDPPDRAEIESLVARAGLTVSRDAEQALHILAMTLEPGDFRQTLEKIAIYKIGDDAPLTPDEIAALAPATTDAVLADVVNAAADAEYTRLGPLFRRLEAQGATPVSICIAAGRHFRSLFAAASDPAGPAAALGRMRPPVWGPRRDRMRRQATALGAAKLDTALRLLVDADLSLRSSSPTPDMELMERTLIRIAMLSRR